MLSLPDECPASLVDHLLADARWRIRAKSFSKTSSFRLNKFRIGISETAVWHRFTGNVLIWKIKQFLKIVLISYFVQFYLMQMSLFSEKELVMLAAVAFAS